jgi:hypothetical protein
MTFMTISGTDESVTLAQQLLLAFSPIHGARPSRLLSNRHNPESIELQSLLENTEWHDVPHEFFCDSTVWILLTQNGLDYFLPGLALGCVRGIADTRALARHMLNEICVTRSVPEWLITLTRYSDDQCLALKEVIEHCRRTDPEFWINTSFDEALAARKQHSQLAGG